MTLEEDQVVKPNVEDQRTSAKDQLCQLDADKTIENFNSNEISKPSSSSTTSVVNPDEPCSTATLIMAPSPITNGDSGGRGSTCYNQVLDDEIRSRLDKLNALSDLINSLERQFDEANSEFRETLKCSTSRLSSIAKTVGTKSIRQSRVYHAAKVSVEQSQSDCQRACVQFEQANKDHQFAKNAIREAESKLKDITANGGENCVISNFNTKLKIHDSVERKEESGEKEDVEEQQERSIACDTNNAHSSSTNLSPEKNFRLELQDAQVTKNEEEENKLALLATNASSLINSAAKLSEELNQAITKLVEAERKRGQSERLHLDQASKLMVAQENLLRLEREYGPTIRRTQLYFDEAKRFNAKLSSVKRDICRISEDILRAKQAYAKTLKDLEQFSDDLHETGIVN